MSRAAIIARLFLAFLPLGALVQGCGPDPCAVGSEEWVRAKAVKALNLPVTTICSSAVADPYYTFPVPGSDTDAIDGGAVVAAEQPSDECVSCIESACKTDITAACIGANCRGVCPASRAP